MDFEGGGLARLDFLLRMDWGLCALEVDEGAHCLREQAEEAERMLKVRARHPKLRFVPLQPRLLRRGGQLAEVPQSERQFRLRGRISSSRPNFVFRAEFRLQGRISSSRTNFVFRAQFRLQGAISSSEAAFLNAEDFRFRAEFRLQDEFRLRDRISSSARPKPNLVFTRFSSSGPIFVFKYRLRAQFELQLLANNFVFKSFGISASEGGRNRDPVSRVNA